MTGFDVDGRAAEARRELALLRLHVREQVLIREQARPPHPLRTGNWAALPLQVAKAAVDDAAAEAADAPKP